MVSTSELVKESYRKRKAAGIHVGPKFTWEAKQMEAAVTSYVGGASLRAAAAQYGVPYSSLWIVLKERGCNRLRTKVDQQALEAAVASYNGGVSITSAAKRNGLTPSVFYNYLTKNGLKK